MTRFLLWMLGALSPEPVARTGYDIIYDGIRRWSAREDVEIHKTPSLTDYAAKMERPLMLLLAYSFALILTFRDDEYEQSQARRVRRLILKLLLRVLLLVYLLHALLMLPDKYNDRAATVTIITLPSTVYAYFIIVKRALYGNTLLFISWYEEWRIKRQYVKPLIISVSDTAIAHAKTENKEAGEFITHTIKASRSLDSVRPEEVEVKRSTFICRHVESDHPRELKFALIHHSSKGDVADPDSIEDTITREAMIDHEDSLPVALPGSTYKTSAVSWLQRINITAFGPPLAVGGLTLLAPRTAKIAVHCYVIYHLIKPALDSVSCTPTIINQTLTSSMRRSRSVLTRRNTAENSANCSLDMRNNLRAVRGNSSATKRVAIDALGRTCYLFTVYDRVSNCQPSILY